MKRRSYLLAAVAAIMALAAVSIVAAAKAQNPTSGKGFYLEGDAKVQLSFKAGKDDMGNFFGEVQYTNNAPGPGALKWHGTVECYYKEGNHAYFSGPIDSSSGGNVASTFLAHVVDNGKDRKVNPDQFGVEFTGNNVKECDENGPDVETSPLIGGSIVVR